tara:strand:+ start:206 stop:661 length:456 start_codon:yes stop_codon:yes gene_type:complete
MNLEDINNLKDNQRNIERSQSKLLVDYLKQQDEFWEFQGLSEQIAFDKNQNDMILLSSQISEWIEKSKNEDQKKLLTEMFLKSIRISGYVFHLETISKHSISLYRQELANNKRLLSEKRSVELKYNQFEKESNEQIKTLKKEIEFISSANK